MTRHSGACSKSEARNKPGKQPGAEGYGRTQTFPITGNVIHRAEYCAACNAALPDHAPSLPYTAWNEIDVERVPSGGLAVTCVHHTLVDIVCDCCGHTTRTQPYRAEADSLWENVNLTEWRLIGPQLAAIIVMLSLRMRLSRARIRELLHELFGITLSVGVIDQTIHEAGRACDPLEAVLLKEIEQAVLVHADETSWYEGAKLCWLWVLLSTSTVFYFIGERTKEMLHNALGADFAGVLMADGYKVYRAYLDRLRCWAHLLRKIRGLEESTDGRIAGIGGRMLLIFTKLMEAILSARENPPSEPLTVLYRQDIKDLRELCERHKDDIHKKLRDLAREFIIDFDIILRQVSDPNLPLTNNPSESALRPMVIARYISHGTRCPNGTRAYALLASVIETCRLRKASSWRYLAEVIKAARHGAQLPAMPPAQPKFSVA